MTDICLRAKRVCRCHLMIPMVVAIVMAVKVMIVMVMVVMVMVVIVMAVIVMVVIVMVVIVMIIVVMGVMVMVVMVVVVIVMIVIMPRMVVVYNRTLDFCGVPSFLGPFQQAIPSIQITHRTSL